MRWLSFVCAAVVLLQTFPSSAVLANPSGHSGSSPPAAGTPANLNLSSTHRNLPASALGISSPMSILVGNSAMRVLPTTLLTPAEYIAASQVMSGGAQSIQLGATGAAVGGAFALTGATAANIGNLSVPANVKMVENFSAVNALNFAGNLTNAGSIFAYSTTPLNAATMNATNIYNQQSGLITTVLSTPGFGSTVGNAVPNLALTLNATGNIINQGKITSAGDLNIGSANVTNSGLLSSLGGNVNFSAPLTAAAGSGTAAGTAPNLTINNTGGLIQASLGDINVRDSSFTGNANATLTGGQSIANNLNLYSGCGAVNVNMDKINGIVNVTANVAHVTANGGTLALGKMNLGGDPTFYNTNGDVEILGDVSFPGVPLAIVASRDIIASSGASISTAGAGGDGGDLTMIAGANFTLSGGASSNSPVTNGGGDSGNTLTILGPSATGGSIDLSDGGNITTNGTGVGSTGGNLTMVAYQSNSGSGGRILAPNSNITTGGTGQTFNGNVTMLAPNGISYGSIDTTGSTGNNGNVLLSTNQPVIAGGANNVNQVSILDGAVQSGSGSFVPSAVMGSGVITGGDINAGAQGSVSVTGATGVSIGNVANGSQLINIAVPRIGNLTTANIGGGPLTVSVANGGSATMSIINSFGDVSIVAGHTITGDITASNAGNVSITGTGIAAGNITTQTGSILLTSLGDGSSHDDITTNNLRTSGGAITVNTDHDFTATYAVATGGVAPFGNVQITSQGQVTLTGSVNGTFGANKQSGNFSLIGNSIIITTLDGIIKPTDNALIAQWAGTHHFSMSNGGALIIAPVTILTSTGSSNDLVLSAFASPGSDYVAVATGNISAAKPISINTSSTTGLGGQVLLVANMNFNTTDNQGFLFIDTSNPSSAGGNIKLAGSSITTSGGAAVTLLTNGGTGASGVTSAGNIQIGSITAGDGGTITLNTFSAGGIVLSGPLSANGSASTSNPNGGTITLAGNYIGASGVSPILLSANSNSTDVGNGGTINLVTAQTTALYIGGGASQFSITANGGSTGGNGGSVTIRTEGDINVDAAFLSVNANGTGIGNRNGNGGSINLTPNGNVTLTNSNSLSQGFNVSGAGNGSGGLFAVNSANNLTISTSITADGGNTDGNGGTIFLNAEAISINSPAGGLSFSAQGHNGGANGGFISLQSALTSVNGPAISINASGGGYGNGGSIFISAGDQTNNFAIGNQLGGMILTATGGSQNSNAGDGGTISVLSAGSLSVDVKYLTVTPKGINGNGGNIELGAGQFSGSGSMSIFSSGSQNLDASGVGIGNGGSITVSDPSTGDFSASTPTIQVATNISANSGETSGNGGNISFVSQPFSTNGLMLAGAGDVEIDFASGVNLLSAVPIQFGSGGSIVLWADRFVTAGSPIQLNVYGFSQSAATPGNGGYLAMVTNAPDGDINIGTSFKIFGGGHSSNDGISNGTSVQLWATGGGNINIDAAAFTVSPTGNQGAAGLVSFSTIIGGGQYVASGPAPLDTYGGTINIFGTGGLVNNSIGMAPAVGFYIAANSFSPISITTSIDVSGDNGGQSLYISNLAPGGVSLAGGITLSSDGPSNTNGQGGSINISTSHIVITGSGPAIINARGGTPFGLAGSDGNVAIFTTDPSPSGDLTLGNGDQSLIVQNSWFSASSGGSVTISAGGNLTVGFSSLVMGQDNLVLSAGLYPANLSIPVDGGPAVYTSPVPYDATKSNSGSLNILAGIASGNNDVGEMSPNGAPGMQIFLLSNSQTAFTVGNSYNHVNGLSGSVVATTSGTVMGNIVIANFGTGGITLDDPSVLQVASPSAGGSTGTALPAPFAVPLPNGNPSTGIIELYTPTGVLTLGSTAPFNATTVAAGAQGGYIYLNASDITVAGGGQLNFYAYSQSGNGGGVAIITNDSSSNLVVGSGNLSIYTYGAQSSGNGGGGPISIVAGGNLTVDPSNLNNTGNGTDFNGPQLNLAATTGILLVNGSIQAGGLGSGAGGSVTLSWGIGDAVNNSFSVGGVSTSGVEGSVTTTNGLGTLSGPININYLGTAASPIVYANTALGLAGSNINFDGNNQFLSLVLSTPPAATVNATAGQVYILTGGSVTVGNLIAYNGAVVVSAGGSLTVAPGSHVWAEGLDSSTNAGQVNLFTTDTSGASSINIGANAFISGSTGTTFGTYVNISIGTPGTVSGLNALAGFTVNSDSTYNPGNAYFNITGNGAITSPGSTVNAMNGNVFFNNASTSSGAINIGAGAIIQGVLLPALDLNDATNTSYVHSLQVSGVLGSIASQPLTINGGSGAANGGSVIIPQNISTRNLSALNIPFNVTVQFDDLNSKTPVNVAITDSSTSGQAQNYGSLLLNSNTSQPANATFNVTSTATTPSSPLLLTSGFVGIPSGNLPAGSIAFNVGGTALIAGTAIVPDTISISTTAGSGGGIFLVGTLTASTVNVSADGSGGITGGSHAIQAGSGVSLSTGTGIIGGINIIATSTTPLLLSVQTGSSAFINTQTTYAPTQLMGVTVGVAPQNQFVLATSGSISQGIGIVSAGYTNLTADNGYVGTPGTPILTNSPTIFVQTGFSAGAAVPAGAIGISDSHGDVNFQQAWTAGTGDILLQETGTGTLKISGTVSTNGGNITIANTYNNGVISIGDNVQIISLSQTTSPNILFSIFGNTSQGNTPDGMIAINSPGSFIYSNGFTTTPSTLMQVFALGNGGTTVNFAGGGLGISLGNGIVVAAGNTSINSLDLTDANTASNIFAIQRANQATELIPGVGGTLVLGDNTSPTPGAAIGGTLTLADGSVKTTLPALNIPSGVTATLDGLQGLNVALTLGSTTTSATINGRLSIIDSPLFQLNITSQISLSGPTSSALVVVPGNHSGDGLISSVGILSVVAPSIYNAGTIIGGSLQVASPSGQSLTIYGATSPSSGFFHSFNQSAVLTSSSGALNFASGNIGLGTFTYVNSLTDALLVGAGTSILASGAVQVNSPGINGPIGGIQANQLILNSGASVQGTIENPNGDVVLNSPLVFNGKNLAIIASGNILATSKLKSIDLSNTKAAVNGGDGGNLLLLAGFDFVAASASSTPVLGSFTITGPSNSGGSILLSGVSINTSTTVSTRTAGGITAEAESGAINSGIAQFGTITATASKTNGTGGFVVINAGGGIMTKAINTSAANGNLVSLTASNPNIFGTVTISDAAIESSGGFYTGAAIAGSGAAINVAGAITTASAVGTAGSVLLNADQQIVVSGGIAATGLANSPAINGAGGQVLLNSLEGSVTTGAINVNGVGITSKTSTQDAGRGGSVVINAGTAVTVTGNITANGGNNVGTGAPGFGGTISLASATDSGATAGGKFGSISINGFVQAMGGAKTGGAAFGGSIFLTGNTVQVLGVQNGVSINAGSTGGASIGSVAIFTYGVQTLPANFDLTSKTLSEVALPGGMITVGLAKPVNGTAGNIVADPAHPLTKTSSTLNHLGFLVGPTDSSGDGIDLNISGLSTDTIAGVTNPITSNVTGTAKRTLITPSEGVVLFQQERAQTPLTVNSFLQANPGQISVGQAQLPATFSKFNLPTGFTLTISGALPVVNLPTAASLIGTLSFTGDSSNNGTAFVNFGSGSTLTGISGAHTGTITALDNLMLSGTSGTWNNNGLIESVNNSVIIARPTAAKLTFNDLGLNANIQTLNGLLLSKTVDAGMSFAFQAKGSKFDADINFGNVLVPSMYTAVATNLSKSMVTTPNVTITEALAAPGGGQVNGGGIGGTLNGGTITISSTAVSLKTISGTVSTPTDITIDAAAVLTATTKLTVTAAGMLTVGDGAQLTGGVLAANAPTVGLLAPSAIVTAGLVSLTSNGPVADGGVLFTGSSIVTANGGNVTITSKGTGAQTALGDVGTFQANGGSIFVYSKATIDAGGQNTFYARSTTAASNKGGGVEFGGGITSGGSLTTAFSKPAGTTVGVANTPANLINANVNGAVVLNKTGTGQINSTGSSAFLLLNHGAVGVDAVGTGAVVDLDQATVITEAIKPVSNIGPGQADEVVVDTAADADDDGICDQNANPLKMVMAK